MNKTYRFKFYLFVITIFLVFTQMLQAEVIQSNNAVKISEDSSRIHLRLDDSGKVYSLYKKYTKIVEKLQLALFSKKTVDYIIEPQNAELLNVVLHSNEQPIYQSNGSAGIDRLFQGYRPTGLTSMFSAKDLFQGLHRKFLWGDQCYQRAEIWAKDMHDQKNINSMKLYLFYTKKFEDAHNEIASYKKGVRKHHWWFHTAPYVLVKNELEPGFTEVVLDPEFLKEPVTVREWLDWFLMEFRGTECPMIDPSIPFMTDDMERFKLFHDPNHYCFILKAPMYYMQPVDIDFAYRTQRFHFGFRADDLDMAEKKRMGKK